MKETRIEGLSDEFLNAFVDNQLEAGEKSMAFDFIENDENLKARVCDLRGLKEMVQHAYHQPSLSSHGAPARRRNWPAYFQPMAACLILVLGIASGWFGHVLTAADNDRELKRLFQVGQNSDFSDDPRKIILQVSNSNPARLKSALDESESLLDSYRKEHRQLQLEIIANSSGAALLRADVSPYAVRLGAMQAKYPNLDLVICGQTVGRLREQGVDVQLLPHANVVPSAAQQIKERLQQGWDYVRI